MIKKVTIFIFVITALTSCSSKPADAQGGDDEKKRPEFFSPFRLF